MDERERVINSFRAVLSLLLFLWTSCVPVAEDDDDVEIVEDVDEVDKVCWCWCWCC